MTTNHYNEKTETFTNQKILIISNIPSIKETTEARRNAIARLKNSTMEGNATGVYNAAYMIWTELADNKEGFEWKLSFAFFRDYYGISEATYKRAIKLLEFEKFLVKCNVEGKVNYWYFNATNKVKAATEKKEEPHKTHIELWNENPTKKIKGDKATKEISYHQFVDIRKETYGLHDAENHVAAWYAGKLH